MGFLAKAFHLHYHFSSQIQDQRFLQGESLMTFFKWMIISPRFDDLIIFICAQKRSPMNGLGRFKGSVYCAPDWSLRCISHHFLSDKRPHSVRSVVGFFVLDPLFLPCSSSPVSILLSAKTLRQLLRPISMTPSPPPVTSGPPLGGKSILMGGWLIVAPLTASQAVWTTVWSEVDSERQVWRRERRWNRERGRASVI